MNEHSHSNIYKQNNVITQVMQQEKSLRKLVHIEKHNTFFSFKF